MRNKGEFVVRNDSEVFVLFYNWNFRDVNFQFWVKVVFIFITEMDACPVGWGCRIH